MAWWFGSSSRSPAHAVANPRRHERYRTTALSSRLGDVLDLSAGGARICSETKPALRTGDVLSLDIGSSRQRVQVSARVAWVKRTKWREWQFGIQFLSLPPAAADLLVELARFGFVTPRSAPSSASTASSASGASASSAGAAGPRIDARAEIENLYAILEVDPAATTEQITHQYRALARLHHPDVSKEPDAAERFTLLTKAYSVLRDSRKRAKYDEMVRQAKGPAAA